MDLVTVDASSALLAASVALNNQFRLYPCRKVASTSPTDKPSVGMDRHWVAYQQPTVTMPPSPSHVGDTPDPCIGWRHFLVTTLRCISRIINSEFFLSTDRLQCLVIHRTIVAVQLTGNNLTGIASQFAMQIIWSAIEMLKFVAKTAMPFTRNPLSRSGTLWKYV